ncbi:MAG TPA: hypothetical protein VG838_16665 [Opitutaceae bacterium]|nr:hypothetical protein [Opitutaceae bacterium]
MSHAPKPDPSATPPAPPTLVGVRFSLAEMLEELKLERTSGAFAMEKLGQAEIGKLFKNRVPRRAKPKK